MNIRLCEVSPELSPFAKTSPVVGYMCSDNPRALTSGLSSVTI